MSAALTPSHDVDSRSVTLLPTAIVTSAPPTATAIVTAITSAASPIANAYITFPCARRVTGSSWR